MVGSAKMRKREHENKTGENWGEVDWFKKDVARLFQRITYGSLEAKQATNKYKNIFDNQLKDTLR